MVLNVFTRPSTTVVKGPSKHVGVSRTGASLIPGEFVEFNGCKCRGRIIDYFINNEIVPKPVIDALRTDSTTFLRPNDQKWKGGRELFARAKIDGIAFVFHVDSIKDQTYPCNRMANAILFANESTLMDEVLFPLSTTIHCRVCHTRVASGEGLLHAE
jgi:hypothetical protein